jgi:predicted RNA-binding protein associated with RNAse of E/G family
MKQKRSDRGDWHRITRRRFLLQPIEDDHFQGYISLFCLDEVSEPLSVPYAGRRVCVANNGYSWLQFFPQGACHVSTVMFDEQGQVVQWYIDICKRQYMDDQGLLWYEDLYLDVVFLPGDKIELLDVDELDEALSHSIISADEYNLAWNEASRLLTRLEEQRFPLLSLAEHYRASLLAQLPPSSEPTSDHLSDRPNC